MGAALHRLDRSGDPRQDHRGRRSLGKIIAGDGASASKLRPSVPTHVDAVIRKALEKLPADRFVSSHEFAGALADQSFRHGREATVRDGLAGARRRTYAASGAGFVAGAALTALGVWSVAPTTSGSLQRVSIVLPPDHSVARSWSPGRSLAISPDGRHVVYASYDPQNGEPFSNSALSVRSLDAPAVRALPGTSRARQPFFSPDGEWIGFFTDGGELRKVPLAGGSSVPIAAGVGGSTWAFGSWTDDGKIVFSSRGDNEHRGLRVVPSDGGSPAVLTLPDSARGEEFHTYPNFVPGADAVLFEAASHGLRDRRIDAVELDTGERRVVLENAGSPYYLETGHLLFQRDETLMIAPFDVGSLAVTGTGVPLLDEVSGPQWAGGDAPPELTFSRDGTLAYLPAPTDETSLGIVDRDGRFEAFVSRASGLDSAVPRVSPDGRSVAYVVLSDDAWGTVHVYDLERETTNRLTREGSLDQFLAWHPNGRELAVSSGMENVRGLFLKDLAGSERLLVEDGGALWNRNASWSANGELLAYTVQEGALHDIWILPMGGEASPRPFLDGPESEHTPRFSPNGRWLAYVSDQSGQDQVYVRGYPEGQALTVSTDVGRGPLWAPAGDELFFYGIHEGEPKLMTVSVSDRGETLDLGAPSPLLSLRVLGPRGDVRQYGTATNTGPEFDILPDGERFVMVRGPGPAREIVLVQGFVEELRERMGGG